MTRSSLQRILLRLGLLRTSLGGGVLVALTWFYYCLPHPLFQVPTATVITDTRGQLLGAHIAADGQWRFPACQTVPKKFEQAILYFEDQYFYYHPGVNPVSISKALLTNLKARRIVRGGSTISLQVIRMTQQGQPRTFCRKCKEALMALRLELRYTKQQILQLYASHASFGSNVVGIDAAAWRYYGCAPQALSWGEVCALAVLPNAPTLVYPGKNADLLRKKRDFLLDKLQQKGVIDATTCTLAKAEPLPHQPDQLPQIAPHLLQEAIKAGYGGQRITTTLDKHLQVQTQAILARYHEAYCAHEIYNGAMVVVEVDTGHVRAYHGNLYPKTPQDTGAYVNLITSPRSAGSTLKPLLHASMLKEGAILPHTLLPDIPTCIAGYKPKNYSKKYSGAVPASQALAYSLNVPSVRMLQDYSVARFHELLQKLGFATITQEANHYGLSLILGGAEVTLEALASTYASMARVLNHFHDYSARYDPNDYQGISWRPTVPATAPSNCLKPQTPFFDAGAIWCTFEALAVMDRPTEAGTWQHFRAAKKIAWKTGTSYGHRDAWAIGITPEYVVGVWIGNADSTGRPGMTGTSMAAPVMFDVFRLLPKTTWFAPPYDDLVAIATCAQSGHRAGAACETTTQRYVPRAGLKSPVCPYHQYIHLDAQERFRVTSDAYDVNKIHTQVWFLLPPTMEWYYKKCHPFYKPIPPRAPTWVASANNNMEVIYPTPQAKIYIPVDLNGQRQKTVFEATHSVPKEHIHWHLNEKYLGTTSDIHQMEIDTEEGAYTLTLVDSQGDMIVRNFTVLGPQ